MTIELIYAHILNINRGSLQTKSLRPVHVSVFYKYGLNKNGFAGPKSFQGFRETDPGSYMNGESNYWPGHKY